jgi:DNA-binding NtrC family response regulator
MSNSITVLIVDDEPTLCEVLSLYFEMENFHVFKASNGMETIEVIRAHPEINYVISDVRMPDGDGLFVLKFVKQNCPEIKVILLSGFTGNLEEELVALGALALFPKPTDPRKLIEFVKKQSEI